MIFISYAHEDLDRAKRIYAVLQNTGQEIFLDKVSLLPGADWRLEIELALEKCALVLLLCTQKSLTKEGFVQREMRIALDRVQDMPDGKIFIIPLRFDGIEIPRKLAKYNCIDINSPADYLRVQWFIEGVWGARSRQRFVANIMDDPPLSEVENELIDEEIVVLLQGKNSQGEPIFTYLKLTLRNFRRLSNHVKEYKDFVPADWGEVVAAGVGAPSEDLRAEMTKKFNLTDVPKPAPIEYEYDVQQYILAFREAFTEIFGTEPSSSLCQPPINLPADRNPWQEGLKSGIASAKRLLFESRDISYNKND